MAQMGFFDLSERYASLDAKKDPLLEIDAVVPWEEFRPALERIWRKPDADRKSRAGRKPIDAVLMNGFMADFNAPFMQQIFDVAERKRKSNVHRHGKAIDFWARLEVAEWGAFCHSARLRNRPARLKVVSSDKTP